MTTVSPLEEMKQEVERLKPWYHRIDLGNGIITPGHDWDHIWDLIRNARKFIDYRGKTVLDIASWDGLHAFEAEKAGADMVVATDCFHGALRNFLFCREALKSKVIPYYNVSPYNLFDRLDVVRYGDTPSPTSCLFDIVQHTGLFYHLRDPLRSLSQARSVLKRGGYLVIETAAIAEEESPFLLFNGIPPSKPTEGYWYRVYNDVSTWWAPTIPCLKEMLNATLFEPIDASLQVLHQMVTNEMYSSKKIKYDVSRVCLVAKAISSNQVDQQHYEELARGYRHQGFVISPDII